MELKQKKTFSPKQVSRAIGVSEASIKRWCDKGILVFSKTAGGHRRLPLHVVLDFVRENDFSLVQPEVLDLPAAVGSGERTIEQASRCYVAALEEGDESKCLQIVMDMRIAGHDMATIGDQVIAKAFHALGQRWEHGDVAVYQERRGVEITRLALMRLKDTLPPHDGMAPLAVGGTLSGDAYSLPSQLGELVLLELGWQARFMGCGLPAQTLAQAVEDLRPRVLWLSVSHVDDNDAFVKDYQHLHEVCVRRHCAVVVGGRALKEPVRQAIEYASFGDNMRHLLAFAQSLYRTG